MPGLRCRAVVVPSSLHNDPARDTFPSAGLSSSRVCAAKAPCQLDTLDTLRHPSTPSRLVPRSSVSRCQTRHLDTARHRSTPLDTARHRSTPLDNRSTSLDSSDDLTQQRRRPIWSHRVRKSGLQQQYLAGSTFIPQLQPLKSSRSSCGSVAPLLM